MFKKFISRNRRNFFLRKLNSACIRYNQAYENLSYQFEHNGEKRVIDLLSTEQFKVVFDVGANVGHWSQMAARNFPTASIHSFEVMPPTFEKMSANTKGLPNVKANQVGLSNLETEIDFKYFPNSDALSTAFDYPHQSEHVIVKGRLTTGALYCQQHNITHIDFLKIDVEGLEMKVLEGFGDLLQSHRVDFIQFEYGRVNILSKDLLRDFYLFFGKLGYKVGKIYPTYVDFSDYSLGKENFLGPNFLAVSEKKSAQLKKLAG
jgi:FkbM family methyltransferase